MTLLICIRIKSAIHRSGCALLLVEETPEIFEGRSLDPCFCRATIRLKEVTPGRRDYEKSYARERSDILQTLYAGKMTWVELCIRRLSGDIT